MLYIQKHVDIDALCRCWVDYGEFYQLDDGMLNDFLDSGILTNDLNYENIVKFPQTIGKITFYSKEQLVDFVLRRQ